MAVEWTKDMLVLAELAHAARSGGLTVLARSALAKRFGVSEEVLLRYECARCAYNSLIGDKQWDQARLEATLRFSELEKRIDEPGFPEEIEKALARIRAATPENEITRELDEATAALRAALDASTSPPTADSDR
jgi:hypothetical protein